MIEINFAFKQYDHNYIIHKQLIIGHGFPTRGQLNWITLSEVERNNIGDVTYARLIWKL